MPSNPRGPQTPQSSSRLSLMLSSNLKNLLANSHVHINLHHISPLKILICPTQTFATRYLPNSQYAPIAIIEIILHTTINLTIMSRGQHLIQHIPNQPTMSHIMEKQTISLHTLPLNILSLHMIHQSKGLITQLKGDIKRQEVHMIRDLGMIKEVIILLVINLICLKAPFKTITLIQLAMGILVVGTHLHLLVRVTLIHMGHRWEYIDQRERWLIKQFSFCFMWGARGIWWTGCKGRE